MLALLPPRALRVSRGVWPIVRLCGSQIALDNGGEIVSVPADSDDVVRQVSQEDIEETLKKQRTA